MTKNEWFSTPKPERLIEKILKIATNPDDIVLDSFLGSGTTAAVAHKMGRRYIGIEMGEHAYSHCKTRLDKVIDGNDQSGISVSKEEFILENEHIREIGLDINEVKIFNKVLAILGKELNELPKEVIKSLKKLTKVKKVKGDLVWQGGGGYRFYELAPTLIQKDDFDEEIINPAYDANMLASAVALHEGFIYQPDEEQFWKQAYGSENSYLFVTTRYVSKEYLSAIHSNMAGTEYLIIACRSFEDGVEKQYPNITVKKIPQMLLDRCEFGKENYNLNIINPPVYEEDDDDEK